MQVKCRSMSCNRATSANNKIHYIDAVGERTYNYTCHFSEDIKHDNAFTF